MKTENQQIIDNLFMSKHGEVHNSDLADTIYSLLTPNHFRIGKVEADIEMMIRSKIQQSLNESSPIRLVIAFGGYKNIYSSSSPHIDWAEIFHLSYTFKTLLPISKIYEPGIHLEFTMDGEAMSIIDNIPRVDVKTYESEFRNLIEMFERITDKNFTSNLTTFSDFHNYEDISNKIDKRVNETIDTEESKTIIKDRYRFAKNNYQYLGETDLRNITEEEKENILKRSVLKHKHWLDIDFEVRKEYLEGGESIPVVHRKGIPGCYPIKSCKGSVIQFWEGNGVIIRGENKVYPSIVSPHRKYLLKETIEIDSEFSCINNNLKKIDLITT